MSNDHAMPGTTLVELTVLLALLTILAGMTVSATATTRDGAAVRVARDAVGASIGRARSLARLHGSARVVLEPDRVLVESPADSVRERLELQRFGSRLTVDGASGLVVLEFDRLGLGRLANRTIRLQRNRAEARLTLSAYGRVRRW